MYTPQEKAPDPQSEKKTRLETRKTAPAGQDLRWLLAEADKVRGRRVELPWLICGESECMILCAEYSPQSGQPSWMLYRGDGPGSEMLWESVDTDFELLFDVISMFQSQIEKEWKQQHGGFMQASSPVDAPTREEPASSVDTKPAGTGYFENLTPMDFDLLKKQSNILLGRMLVESGIVSEPMLDEALKLQEMVRNDSLTPLQATEALRKAYKRSVPQSEETRKTTAETKRENLVETAAIVDLLKQAGIVTENDISVGNDVRKKHGGDLGQILVSSGKLDKVTYEAANKAWPLVRDNRLRPEQAIIALHYCQRMRVPLREAFNDMGWDAPSEI